MLHAIGGSRRIIPGGWETLASVRFGKKERKKNTEKRDKTAIVWSDFFNESNLR